jgi:hypothetical protein
MSRAGIVPQSHYVCAPIHNRRPKAREFAIRRVLVAAIVVVSTLRSPSAIAQAQRPSNVSTSTSGWWSLQRAGAPMPPHLLLSMIEPNIETSGNLSRPARAQNTGTLQTATCENKYALTARKDAAKARVGCSLLSDPDAPNQNSDLKVSGDQSLLYAQGVQSGFVLTAPGSSTLGFFLYSAKTRRGLTEQYIADPGFLTDNAAMAVYPFMDADLAGSHFCISLYIPPLRGSLPALR